MVLSLTRVCKAPFNDQQQTSSRKRPRHGDTSESMVSSKRVKGASATKRTYSEAEERVLQQASILGVDLCNLASKLNPASSGALNTFVSERIPPDYRHGSSNFPRSAEASCLSSDDVADSATAVYHASETSPLDDPTKVFDAQDYLEDSAAVIGAPFCIAFEPFADDIPFGFPEPPQQGANPHPTSYSETVSFPEPDFYAATPLPYSTSLTYSQHSDLSPSSSPSTPNIRPQSSVANTDLAQKQVSTNIVANFLGSDASSGELLKVQTRRASRKLRSLSDGTSSSPNSQQACRGPFRDPRERSETGYTRKLGACVRCRMQKIRCHLDPKNPGGPCLTCVGLTTLPLSRIPCLRYKLSDASFRVKRDHPELKYSRRWLNWKIRDIKKWTSPEPKVIQLTQDCGGSAFEVEVKPFIPVDGDVLARTWVTNNVKKSYECAPYAIVNMSKTGMELCRFINNSIAAVIEAEIDETNKLLWDTYAMAYRYSEFAECAEERKLLRYVLQFWVALRLLSRPFRICSEETLGMSPQMFDKASSNFGKIPVPPVMNVQLDLMMSSIVIHPLHQAILAQLQNLIHANKTSSWFTIYLCSFILLHSCSIFTAFENGYAKKHGAKSRYMRPNYVEENHNAARIMLAYFHYVSKGAHPFTLDWTSADNIALAHLNPEQTRFVRDTAEHIKSKQTLFDTLTAEGLYENEFYFTSQMFASDWKPIPTI